MIARRNGRKTQMILSLVVLGSATMSSSAARAADVWTFGSNTITDTNASAKIGFRTSAPKNTLDVKGAAVVGSSYGGTNTAPSDGLLVQGTVGIGTTAPTSGMKLHVVGNVFVSGSLQANGGLKVNSWSLEAPDYVFDPNRFKLMSLGELERYVKDNRHLPEIPSAAEMNKDGIDVADMNMRLLKKVEELTLYVIEQDRRLAEQDKKIKELSSKVK